MVLLERLIRLVALFPYPLEHVQRRPAAESAGHHRDGGVFRRTLFRCRFWQEHNRWREVQAPFARGGFFGQRIAVQVGDFLVAKHIELHDLEVRLDVVGHVFVGEHLFMKPLAIDTAALFDHDRKAFALFLGRLDVFTHVLECDREPRLLMQTIGAQLRALAQSGASNHDPGGNGRQLKPMQHS